MSRRMSSVAVLAGTLALTSLAAARGEVRGAGDPCLLRPYDATAENGLGAGPGFTLEYCSELPPPPANCFLGGYYWVDPTFDVTRTAAGASTIDFETLMRGGPGAGMPPGPILTGPDPFQVPGVPVFPNVLRVETLLSQAAGGPVSASTVLFACALLDGAANPNQFLAVDQTPATPPRPCWGSSNGGSFESCLIGAPNLRALMVGAMASPYRARGTADQVVPPSGSNRRINLRYMELFPTVFRARGEHDAPNPIAIRIRRGPPGVVGPIVTTLTSPTSPFDEDVLLSVEDVERLRSNRLYIEVVNAANPNGAARGQITPAHFIFGDGAESGDLDYWSAVQR